MTAADVSINGPSLDGDTLADAVAGLETPIRQPSSAVGYYGAADRFGKSLNALQTLLALEADKPGRKLLVWLGLGWPLLSGARGYSAKDEKRYFALIVEINRRIRKARTTLYNVASLDVSLQSGGNAFLYTSYLKGSRARYKLTRPISHYRYLLSTPAASAE